MLTLPAATSCSIRGTRPCQRVPHQCGPCSQSTYLRKSRPAANQARARAKPAC